LQTTKKKEVGGPAKRDAVARPSKEQKNRKTGVTHEEVVARLWELAGLPASATKDNIGGQVRAISTLADVLGMKLTRSAGLAREFEGRSSEEQEFFAVHGYWPEQSVEPEQSGAVVVKAACAKTGQPN
jgi:hypothetical protein